jgi:hypothetical protein
VHFLAKLLSLGIDWLTEHFFAEHDCSGRIFQQEIHMSDLANSLPLESADVKSTASITLPGTVEKVIPSPHPSIPEKAQISIDAADDLYKEIRIENRLINEDGKEVKLKVGAEVEVTVAAPAEETVPAE